MIYFDNSATTRIHPDSLKSYVTTSENFWGNPSSLNLLGQKANELLNMARQQIATTLGVKSVNIFFTSGGTESDNWAIKGTAIARRKQGNHIIASSVEHPAVKNTLEQLKTLGFEVTYLPVNKLGQVNADDVQKNIKDETILVTIMAVNNEIGAVQPIAKIANIMTKHPNVTFHVDAVQAVGKFEDQNFLFPGVDLVSLSAHKFHGPRGTGVLVKREHTPLSPLLNGGGQEDNQRSGTENLPAIVAMSKALSQEMENVSPKIALQKEIRNFLITELAKFENVSVLTQKDDNFAPHIICFFVAGVRGETVVHAFEEFDIMLSTTSACSSKKQQAASTLLAMNIPLKKAQTAVRVSLGTENTMQEAQEFMNKFAIINERFKQLS